MSSTGNKDKTPVKKRIKKPYSTVYSVTPVKMVLKSLWLVVKLLLIICITVGCIAAGFLGGAIYAYVRTTTPITPEDLQFKNQTSFVYDANGNEVTQLNGLQNRILVDYDEIPQNLKDAFVSIEDKRFFEHKGIDIRRTAGAFVSFVFGSGGGGGYGGSTITQQLVSNITGNKRRSIQRKIQEQYMAMQLETKLSKEDILNAYMNLIYMGENVYGMESASLRYFGKSVKDLNLAECASLAGITNLPGKYAPLGPNTIKYNKERQEIILYEMWDQGKISREEYDEAIKYELKFVDPEEVAEKRSQINSYFVDQAINDVISDLMAKKGITYDMASLAVNNGGYKIYTTMDPAIQSAMNNVFNDINNFPVNKTIKNPELQAQGAMVIMDPYSGQVKAMYGSFGEKPGNFTFNRATQMERAPGSTFKPLAVYAPAIDTGLITPATVVDDVPSYLDDKNPDKIYPTNYDSGSYKGLTTIHDAVMKSINVVAAKVFVMNPDLPFGYLKKINIDRSNERYVSLALGGLNKGTNPLAIAAGYSTFVNNGIYCQPITYTKVLDSTGNVVLDKKSFQQKNLVFQEQTAYLMTNIMKDVSSAAGTAGNFGKLQGGKMPTAGKTGTSSDWKDKWFAGYSPYYVGVSWYGYDTPKRLSSDEYNQALILWQLVMERAHEGLEPKEFAKPSSGLVEVEICKASGKVPTGLCSRDPRGNMTVKELFIKGTEPTKKDTCNIHVEVSLCKMATSLKGKSEVAGVYCPEADIEKKVYVKRVIPYVRKSANEPYPDDWSYEAPTQACEVHNQPAATPTPLPETIPIPSPDEQIPLDFLPYFQDEEDMDVQYPSELPGVNDIPVP